MCMLAYRNPTHRSIDRYQPVLGLSGMIGEIVWISVDEVFDLWQYCFGNPISGCKNETAGFATELNTFDNRAKFLFRRDRSAWLLVAMQYVH